MRDATTATTPASGGAVGARPATGDPVLPPSRDRARVDALVQELDRLLASAPEHLDELGEDELRERVALARRLQGLATATMATAVAALDRAGAVRADGASSLTAWIAGQTGVSRRQAAREARLAADLDDMPDTRAALAAGRISAESADVVVRAGRDGRIGTPAEVEATLLPLATTETPESLRAEVAARTQQVDGAALARDEARQHALRRASVVMRDDGMCDVNARVSGLVGEKARVLFDAFMTADPRGADGEDRRRPEQRMADAFEAVLDVALDLGPTPTRSGVARPHLSIVVDLATFDTDLADPASDDDRPVAPDDPVWSTLPAGTTGWGRTISPQAVRALCCDAGISRIVTAGSSQVLDVGRLTQTWNAPQRRAIAVRDRCCRGPGCGRPIAWTQVHHIRWWHRDDGPTDVANGLALCTSCHDLVHHHGWTVHLDPTTAAATWTSPTGREVVTHPRPPT